MLKHNFVPNVLNNIIQILDPKMFLDNLRILCNFFTNNRVVSIAIVVFLERKCACFNMRSTTTNMALWFYFVLGRSSTIKCILTWITIFHLIVLMVQETKEFWYVLSSTLNIGNTILHIQKKFHVKT
jgi:hypothetical protein